MKLLLKILPSAARTPMEPTSSHSFSSFASSCIAGSTGCSASAKATGNILPSLVSRPAQYSGVAMKRAPSAAAARIKSVSTRISCVDVRRGGGLDAGGDEAHGASRVKKERITCSELRDFRQIIHSSISVVQSGMASTASRPSGTSSPCDMMASPSPWAAASRAASRLSISIEPDRARPRRLRLLEQQAAGHRAFLAQDQRQLHQLREGHVLQLGKPRAPLHHRHQPVAPQLARQEGRPRRPPGGDGDVDREILQPLDQLGGVARHQPHRKLRVLQPEAGKLGQNVHGGIRADGQLPFLQRPPARQQLERLRFRLELALGDGEELAPHVGQRHAGGRPGEQLHAIGLLELPHMVGNGGLGEPQRLRRAGETAVHGNGVEGLELGVSHIVRTYVAHKNIRFD